MDRAARAGRVRWAGGVPRALLWPLLLGSLALLTGCRQSATDQPIQSGPTSPAPAPLAPMSWPARAEAALGDRDGSVLIAVPATGQLLAVVNPRLAFEQSFPPGSSIKPFTALAALGSRRISLDHRHRCRGGIRDEEGNLLCSHPRLDHPLRLDEALAWSCNDYFISLAARLGRPTFNDYLRQYGFGAPTGIAAREEAGHLAEQSEGIRAAIGEGPDLLVTPIQLLRGYLALVNGGKLCRPRLVQSRGLTTGQCEEAKPRSILEAHRRAIVRGMAGAVTYGTAAAALDGPAGGPFVWLGKTGTAAASNRFRRHGWFVGFAAPPGAGEVPPPEQIELAVLVFLRRGTGAEAAAVAAQLLPGAALRSTPIAQPLPPASPALPLRGQVRVRLAGGQIRAIPLEEYVAGALRAELGHEREAAALEAQSVVIRTFALHNLGRHEREGYDLCPTTHCQRFISESTAHRRAGRAAAATAGLVLRDPAGGVAEVYYHAACGGQTSSVETVWRVPSAPPWLRGVTDPFCAAQPGHPKGRRWEDRLTREQIELALQADPATRGIGRLRNLTPGLVDRAGRVGQITLDGQRQLRISAWDFKLLIGRRLGWQILKSTVFEMSRAGDLYVFRGRGFGHGLGLCQDGAHQMARRGRNFQQILYHYFPGARLGVDSTLRRDPDEPQLIPARAAAEPSQSQTLHDGLIRWIIPGRSAGDARTERARRLLGEARHDLESRIGRQISFPLEIHLHATTASFVAATGLPGWASGATRPRRIDLQPLDLLDRRGILRNTLRHELVHTVLAQFNPECPRWLNEGLAIHFAGEGDRYSSAGLPLRDQPDLPDLPDLDDRLTQRLSQRLSQREARQLYGLAWRKVRRHIASAGEPAVWSMAIERTRTGLL